MKSLVEKTAHLSLQAEYVRNGSFADVQRGLAAGRDPTGDEGPQPAKTGLPASTFWAVVVGDDVRRSVSEGLAGLSSIADIRRSGLALRRYRQRPPLVFRSCCIRSYFSGAFSNGRTTWRGI
jgi:hypothetical protein